jgi:hypothetical protein
MTEPTDDAPAPEPVEEPATTDEPEPDEERATPEEPVTAEEPATAEEPVTADLASAVEVDAPEPTPEDPPEPDVASPDGPAPRLQSHHSEMTDRDANLILARAHLRLGSLGLARAELETMAGRNELDDDGIRDLAEARWRTGDTTGAGEAAAAYLAAIPDDVVALVIAAEAQAELGRPGEARRLAGMAMEGADGSLEPIFAGMRRSSIWPADSAAPIGPVGLLFNELHPSPVAPSPGFDRRASDRPPANGDAGYVPLDPALPAAFEDGPGLWDDQADATFAADPRDLEPTALFHGASAALDAGDTSAAGAGLMLALRSSPELAPAIIDVLAGRNDPMLLLVRADAYELVGRELEAARDRTAAAGGIRPPADQAHLRDEASTAQDNEPATADGPATADQPATAGGTTMFDEAAVGGPAATRDEPSSADDEPATSETAVPAADGPPPADDPPAGA